MKKRTFYFFLLFCCLSIGLSIYVNQPNPIHSHYCAFCDSDVIDRQKFYEDEFVLVLYTHKPIVPSHFLIIPKRHVERFELLSDSEVIYINKIIKQVNKAAQQVFNTSSYLILQKNGSEVGQTVPHVHFHYLSRKLNDDSIVKLLFRMYMVNLQSPLSIQTMRPIIKQMHAAMLMQTE